MTTSTTTTKQSAPLSGAWPPRDGADPANAGEQAELTSADSPPVPKGPTPSIPPLRKAAIVLVSLEQSLASQLLAHLDRSAIEAVTWEIARLDRVEPAEQTDVLEEFLGLGLSRLCFGFDDLLRMSDRDIRAAYHDEDAAGWALALAGAAPLVRAKVMGALDAMSTVALRQYMESLGPFRLSDAEAAQAEIAERFRRLCDQGSISLPEPSGQEEVLV
jgi:flagellar motor switch protein FliG